MKEFIKRKYPLFYLIAAAMGCVDLILFFKSIFSSGNISWVLPNLYVYSATIIPSLLLIVLLIVSAFINKTEIVAFAFSILAYERISSLWVNINSLEDKFDLFNIIGITFELFACIILVITLVAKYKSKTTCLVMCILPAIFIMAKNYFWFLWLNSHIGTHLIKLVVYAILFLFVGLAIYFQHFDSQNKTDGNLIKKQF